jgi:hypothetical protein
MIILRGSATGPRTMQDMAMQWLRHGSPVCYVVAPPRVRGRCRTWLCSGSAMGLQYATSWLRHGSADDAGQGSAMAPPWVSSMLRRGSATDPLLKVRPVHCTFCSCFIYPGRYRYFAFVYCIPGGGTSSATFVMNYWQEIVVEKSTRILPGMGVQFIF